MLIIYVNWWSLYIISNARKQLSIRNPETDNFLELDIWIPDLNLGFEFQVYFAIRDTCPLLTFNKDAHHYETTWYASDPMEKIKQRDGIYLIWTSSYLWKSKIWNMSCCGSMESLLLLFHTGGMPVPRGIQDYYTIIH